MVCDTFHASFDAALAGWLLETLSTAASIVEPVPLTWDPIAHRAALYEPEEAAADGWTVKRCDLSGYAGAYQFIARGRGVWDGVVLAFGEPRERDEDRPDATAMRRVRVMLGSELLWRNAVKGGTAYDAMRGMINALAMPGSDDSNVIAFAPDDLHVKPARIDVCRDHFGYEWCHADLYQFAGRTRDRGGVETYRPEDRFWERPEHLSAYHGATTATYYVGKRGARCRFLRIYDKTEEAKVTGKLPWLEPLWEQYGWKRGTKVWRCEIEHGSEWLDEHGCRSLADVVGFEHAAWRRYTVAMRHTTVTKSEGVRMTRQPSSAVWSALSELPDSEPTAWRWATRKPSVHVDMDRMAKQAAGCAARMAPMLRIPAAADHPLYGKILPATAPTPAEVRQATIEMLRPMIEEALREQAEATLAVLTDQLYERETRHIPKEQGP